MARETGQLCASTNLLGLLKDLDGKVACAGADLQHRVRALQTSLECSCHQAIIQLDIHIFIRPCLVDSRNIVLPRE